MRKILSILGFAAISLLGVAGTAHASDYGGTCSDFASSGWTGPGSILINESGACTINQDLSATGNIKITATGAITLKKVTAGANVQLSTTSGSIEADTIDSNTAGNGGNVLLKATGNVKTKTITAHTDTDSYGAVEIKANTNNATSTPFTLGANTSNGVNGSISTSTNGGGSDSSFVHGGVFITNGNSSATGGITVTAMSNIQVVNVASRSAAIILNAQNGTLTLPTGTLNADGPSGYGAGHILLFANTITTGSGTVISASQTAAASGTYHYVMLAANTINVAGSGLEVRANGNGVASGSALAALLPKGSMAVSSSDDYANLFWGWDWSNYGMITTEMKVTGSAPIKVTANGDYSQVFVSGSPITFENSDVTLEAKGATDHQVWITNSALPDGPDVSFDVTGNVLIDASSDNSGNGGTIYMPVHDLSFDDSSGTVVLKANAVNSGNGGEINVYAHTITMLKDSFAVQANGPASGDGDGGKIYIGTSWDSGSGFILDRPAVRILVKPAIGSWHPQET